MFKWIVLAIFILAFSLRILYIPSRAVSFHYDMARDAFEAQRIWKDHDLKILGPPTSTPGLYHGVIYYYLIAPFYGLSGGDPRVVAVFFSLINALVIIPVVSLARDLFKSERWAILSGIFFVFSFEGSQYGPWISNPAPAVLTVALYFLFLRLWQKGKTYGLYLAVLLAALSTQFQFFLIYLFLLIPIFGFIFKIKTRPKVVLIACVVAILGLINFFLAAVKFQTFTSILAGFLNISTAGQIDFRAQFTETFLNYVDKFAELFTFNFFPTSVFWGGILSIFVLYAIRREHLLLFYLFSNLPLFIFGGHTNTYVNIGLVVPAILSVVFLLRNIYRLNRVLILAFIALSLMSNLFTIFKYNPEGQVILVIPNDMVLKNQLKIIDETYQKSEGQPFSINTLTLPLWTNTTWAYLYSWYGREKYGYLPKFLGHDQIGLLGADVLERVEGPLNKTFFIIEPHVGIPDDIYNLEAGAEDSKTKLISETKYGDLRLQFRKPKNE